MVKGKCWARIYRLNCWVALVFIPIWTLAALIIGVCHFFAVEPSDAPAWVQAIGSVLAVLVAICFPLYLRYQDGADRHNHQAVKLQAVIWQALTATKQVAGSARDILDAQEARATLLSELVWEAEPGQEVPPAVERGVRVSSADVEFFSEVLARAQSYLDGEFFARRLVIGSRFSFDLSVLLFNLRKHADGPPSEDVVTALEKADRAFRGYYSDLQAAYPRLKKISF